MNTIFDPFEQGALRRRLVQAAQGDRIDLLASSLAGMAGGLRGIGAVVDLADLDPALFVAGLTAALRQNPANITAARALIWHYIRNDMPDEADTIYSTVEPHWPDYAELFREHLRMIVVLRPTQGAAAYFDKNRKFFKGVAAAAYHLQVLPDQHASEAKGLIEALFTSGALAFRAMLMGPPTGANESLKKTELQTLWRLSELLAGRGRIALVGNAATLSGKGLGETIDQFDVVIRCNFPELSGHRSDVGHKTDVMFFNESLRARILEKRAKETWPSGMLCVGLHPEADYEIPTPGNFEGVDLIGTIPGPVRKFIADICYSRSTTGLMAINLIIFVFHKRITLFGFDFFKDKARPHYFGHQVGAYLGHELQYERWYVEDFLQKFFPNYITVQDES